MAIKRHLRQSFLYREEQGSLGMKNDSARFSKIPQVSATFEKR
jgi:hypothetical protein